MRPEHIITINWVYIAVQAFTVGFRMWVLRLRRPGKYLRQPDYFILLSFFISLGLSILNMKLELLDLKGVRNADTPMERALPLAALSQQDVELYKKYGLSAMILYFSVLWSVKASFLATYTSLKSHMNKPMRVVLHWATWVVWTTYVAVMMLHLLWCRPLSRTWRIIYPTDPQFCTYVDIPTLAVYFAFNIAADLFLLIFPMFLLKSMRLRERELTGIVFIALMGSLSILAATIRLSVLLPTFNDLPRRWLWKQRASIWGMTEQTAAIVASCLPAFRVYLRRKASDDITSSAIHEPQTFRSAEVQLNTWHSTDNGGWDIENRFEGAKGAEEAPVKPGS